MLVETKPGKVTKGETKLGSMLEKTELVTPPHHPWFELKKTKLATPPPLSPRLSPPPC